MEEILRAADNQHFHIACTRVFECTHGGRGLADGDSVTHPNQYAARSRELEKERAEEIIGSKVEAMDDVKTEDTKTEEAEAMVIDEPMA